LEQSHVVAGDAISARPRSGGGKEPGWANSRSERSGFDPTPSSSTQHLGLFG
jgi:hypothetical protein